MNHRLSLHSVPVRFLLALFLASALGLFSLVSFSGRAHAEGETCGPPFSECYVHTATSGNTAGDSTWIDDPALNNHPGLLLFVTPNWNPPGASATYDPHPIGVWYDWKSQKYAIFNEDRASMPLNAAFNIGVAGSSTPAFTATVTADHLDSTGTSLYLDNLLTNNIPSAVLVVTQNWDLTGAGGVYNNDTNTVWYDRTVNKWAIANNSAASGALKPLPMGAVFNVLVEPASNSSLVHVSASGNTYYDYTIMDYPASHLNGFPNDLLFVTPRWTQGTYTMDIAPVGVWYTGSYWSIFNEDVSSMGLNDAFDAVVIVKASL